MSEIVVLGYCPSASFSYDFTISSAQSQMATIECYPSSADDLHYGRVLKDSEIHLDGVETLNCEL